MAQSAGATEYSDYLSTEKPDSPNECPWYNTKKSDGEAPVMQGFGECGVPLYCYRLQFYSGLEWYHLTESYLWIK